MIDIHVEVAGIPIDSEKTSFLESTKYLKGGPLDIKGHIHDFAGLYNEFLLMVLLFSV